ncbi:PepSY-like domain-containing protein [Hymenobacter rigui]|uniref:Putative beta-lactamase-inhibitor-like PepSY-like domain-containing protein n=1 Tax=Hymenobacter rigui TaxID=334424 RepID=A0A3R9N7H1_9BACT|nr:PepSY-like domain-containing protein [Hymenobacter rigui]RSK50049.1 hypothetical protein EI291_05195 [Hymenobacter rigui]
MNYALLLAALLPLAAQAQKLSVWQVPAAAVTAFRTQFPEAKTVHWEKEAANYEADFAQKGVEMSAVFTAAGVLVETESAIRYNLLPALARTALAQQYKGYKIVETAKIVSAGGIVQYEAEVSRSGKRQDVLFDSNGRLLSK